jgi:hypothetical protein
MTTYRDVLLRKGKESPTTLFSATYQFDNTNASQVASTLAAGTDPAMRKAVYVNPTVVSQFLVAADNRLFVVTLPAPATDNVGNPVIIANMSDTLGQTTPVAYQTTDFERYFTSLVPLAEVEAFFLPVGEENPDDLDGPLTAPPVGQESEIRVQEAPSMARLNFGPDATGKQPRIVALPVFLPLAQGYTFPSGHPIPEEVPNQAGSLFWALVEMWRKAILYCITQNEGVSVTRGGPLFDITQISAMPFTTTPTVFYVQPPALMLPIHSPQFSQVVTRMQVALEEAYIRLGSNMAVADTPQHAPNVPNPTVGGLAATDMIQLLNTIKQAPVSMADKELADEAIVVENRFRLICARIITSDNPAVPATVVPAVITPEFRSFLQTKSRPSAHRQFCENFETSLHRAASSEDRLSGLVTFQPGSCDEIFTRSLKLGNMLTEPLNHLPEQAKHKVSVVNFASPPLDNAEYEERLKNGQLTYDLTLRGDEAKAEARKPAELFLGGRMSTGADIQALIANIIVVMSWCVQNFTSSHWCQQLLKYELLLKNNSRWCMHYAKLPTIGYNMVSDLQDISAMYFAVGNQAMYRQALANGDALSPVTWEQAMGIGDQILTELRACMQRFQPARYGETNRFYMENYRGPQPIIVHPTTEQLPVVAKVQQTGQPKRARGLDENPAKSNDRHSKKGKQPEPTPQQEEQKKHGFLNWVGQGERQRYPIPCPVTYALPGKSEEKICIRWVTMGNFCGYAPKCNFHHPKTFRDIPQQAQLHLEKYVAKTTGLSFVPGKGPKST